MARPTTKPALLEAARKEHAALVDYLATLTPEQIVEPDIVGPWSAKDVLAHLTAWEQMCLGWYRAGLAGENPPVPAEGYKWNETPALNRAIYEAHKDDPLEEVREAFDRSYEEILGVIEATDEETMFTPKLFAWTRDNAMGTYFVSATGSHYTWARKEIRKGFRAKSKAK